jgi:autoinducer 2-degrading protein
MKVLLARYICQEGRRDEVLEKLREMRDLTFKFEPGCTMYKVHIVTDNPNDIVLYETYEDQEALDEHRNASYFQRIIEGQVIPLLVSRQREVLEIVTELQR